MRIQSGLLVLLLGSGFHPCLAAPQARYQGEPIRYEAQAEHGPVERLLAALQSGEQALELSRAGGYLPALLAALEIPVSSQTLVFSQTSFQAGWISPRTPRALYFGDEVYVGVVPGAPVLEITSVDPVHGPVFYTLDQRTQGALPERRNAECLQCHESSHSRGWPANLLRSVHTAPSGRPLLGKRTFRVGHETPLENRWGGWYVTGSHGALRHMGNTFSSEEEDRPPTGRALDVLPEPFQADRYLSPHSDLVALLVLEHQASMHNELTRAGYEARLALHREAEANRAFGDTPGTRRDSTTRILDGLAERLVAYLLFRDEARLAGPLAGSSSFREDFQARGRLDSEGRSLRDLHLRRYLFRYPCSYLIYSPVFDALPEDLLAVVYARLGDVLTDEEARADYPRLSQGLCEDIVEILVETKTGLPGAWPEAR